MLGIQAYGSDLDLLGEWFINGKMYHGVLTIDIRKHKSTRLTLKVEDDFKFKKNQNIEGVVLTCKYFLYNCNIIDSSFENLKSFSCEYLFIDQYSKTMADTLEDTLDSNFNFKCNSLSVSVDDHSILNYLNANSFSDNPSLLCEFEGSDAILKYTPSPDLSFLSHFSKSGILEVSFKEEQSFQKLVKTLDIFSDFIFLFFNRYLNYDSYFLRKNVHGELVEKSEFTNGNYPAFGIFYDRFIPYDLMFSYPFRIATNNSSFKPTPIFRKSSNNLSTYFNKFIYYNNSADTLYSDLVNLFIYSTSGKITEDLQVFQSQITVLEGLFRFLYLKNSDGFKKKYKKKIKDITLKEKLTGLISLSVIFDNKTYSNLACKDYFKDYLDTNLNESNIYLSDIIELRNYATHLTKKKSITRMTSPLVLNKIIDFNHVLITFYLLYNLTVLPKELDAIIFNHFKYLNNL